MNHFEQSHDIFLEKYFVECTAIRFTAISKWNKIEHRLFSYISMNWRGQPLISHEVIINLIAETTTRKGLKVHAALDNSMYPSGIKVSDAEFEKFRITQNSFHGEWNSGFS